MPEPTVTTMAVATIAAAAASTTAVTAFGVPLGLRADLLVAGFAGALVAIILLSAVPRTGDTWRELIRTTMRRMAFACASSLTAGYLTPLAMLVAQLPEALLLGSAFAVGGGAQQVLLFAIRRLSGMPQPPANPPGGTQGGAP